MASIVVTLKKREYKYNTFEYKYKKSIAQGHSFKKREYQLRELAGSHLYLQRDQYLLYT